MRDTSYNRRNRWLVLETLVGLDKEGIQDRHSVESQTQLRIAYEKTSEWNDPLVEFYKKTPQRERLRNSAHFYLSYNNSDPETQNYEIPHADLVENGRPNLAIFDLVKKEFYDGKIFRVTALDIFATSRSHPIEKLLTAVVGNVEMDDRAENMLRSILSPRLLKEYGGEKFSIRNVYRDVIPPIVNKLKQGALGITKYKEEVVRGVLKELKPREEAILHYYFGLNADEPMGLPEIGAEMSLTPARVGQIKDKALRRLRQKSRLDILEFVTNSIDQEL